MERILIRGFMVFGLVFSSTGLGANITASDVLKKAEIIRNPQTDYVVDVELTELKKKESRTFKTMIKGRDKALVEFIKPSNDAGKKVLMVENNMWIYMPSAAKPIRISPRQKLAGNAAYGDIARLNFIGNYTAKLAKDTKYKGRKVLVLDLKAIKDRPVTYTDLQYWVDAKTFRPVLVQYKTGSGKVMKTGYFEGFGNVFGVQRPTKLRIVDGLRKGRETTLEFKNAKKQDLPGILLEKQNLNRS
jgi:outer membrane lipoprotein-sorting protein